jgi:hypothetical protein
METDAEVVGSSSINRVCLFVCPLKSIPEDKCLGFGDASAVPTNQQKKAFKGPFMQQQAACCFSCL